MGLFIESQIFAPFMENAWLVADEDSGEALLIDPGGPVDALLARAAERKLKILAMVATHAHLDHLGGAAAVQRRLGTPFWLHQDDRPLLEALDMQSLMLGLPTVEAPQVQRWLQGGEQLRLGATAARVVHTPGHSPGGLCLFFEKEKALFSGDTLFRGSVGRSDLPGGDGQALVRAIRDRLFPLGDEVAFYPGHGPGGTLGEERRSNPFVRIADSLL